MKLWLTDPTRKAKRFVDENAEPLPKPKDDPKLAHIIDLATKNGMRPSDLNNLVRQLNPALLVQPESEQERFKLIFYMLLLLLEDLNLDTAEKDFIDAYGVEIGYPLAKVAHITREIYEGIKRSETEEEILSAVNLLLNHTT